jgi:hypothetical protein
MRVLILDDRVLHFLPLSSRAIRWRSSMTDTTAHPPWSIANWRPPIDTSTSPAIRPTPMPCLTAWFNCPPYRAQRQIIAQVAARPEGRQT